MTRWIFGLCVLAVAACSGGKGSTNPHQTGGYSALRWAPSKATYIVTAKTVRQGQQGLGDLIDTFGAIGDVGAKDIGALLRSVLLADPLSPDVSQIGVDLDGGVAIFSEGINPTLVVHMTAPHAFTDFVAKQGIKPKATTIDGTAVFTTSLDELHVSYALADEWLWVHFALPDVVDDADWFTHSHKPGSATWELPKTGEPIVGVMDGKYFVDRLTKQAKDFQACSEMASTIGAVSLTMTGDPKQSNARIAFDIGSAAAGVDRALLPVPEGWAISTQQVPIAAQWNLDLAAVKDRVLPCARLLGANLGVLDEMGIRSGRAFLRSFDPENKVGSGAASLDISHKDFFAAQLDQIPMRSAMERNRTYGPYAGKSLSIPMFLTVDYVLTDQLALAGVGDGLLAVLVGKGGSAKGPVAEIAVQPQGLSTESWIELLRAADIRNPKRVAERLQQWREAHVNLTIDGTRLVLTASGTRR